MSIQTPSAGNVIWIWGSHRLAEEDAIVGNNSSGCTDLHGAKENFKLLIEVHA